MPAGHGVKSSIQPALLTLSKPKWSGNVSAWIGGLLLALFVVGLTVGHGHSHDHGHSHEHEHEHEANPAFKWSREANEDEILEEEIIDLPPQYAKEKPNVQAHGHSHGGHGHSHGGHGHSHGPPQKELTPEERERHRARLHREWDDDDEEHTDTKSEIWAQALLSTLAISLAPFVILFFFSLDNSAEKQGQLKVLLR
ncbi:zinc transporter zipt-7.2-like [Tigriopus californicus]|uniref:zinc transporter zipt-7.2-like n=1 Tax=Tigriopus californicus TaxID=6832 RepID=UPI0027D9E0CC|nr:zinc transporter zipt-7.2-like [Tigriopus californicus]